MFFGDSRFFVATSVLSQFTRFCVEKNSAKNCPRGEKFTDIMYGIFCLRNRLGWDIIPFCKVTHGQSPYNLRMLQIQMPPHPRPINSYLSLLIFYYESHNEKAFGISLSWIWCFQVTANVNVLFLFWMLSQTQDKTTDNEGKEQRDHL